MKWFILIFLLLPFSIICNEKTKITLEEYISLLKKQLLEIELYKTDVLKAENSLYKANSIYDINFYGSFKGIGKKSYPDNTQTELDYSSGFKGEGSFSTTLPSGTKLSIGGQYTQMYSWGRSTFIDYQKLIQQNTVNELENDFFTTTWDPLISINLTQPVIYNWFGFLDRYVKKDAKLKLEIQKLKKQENEKEIINYYTKIYFLWFQYGEILKFLENTIENAKALENQTRQKLTSGIVENDELQRAKYSLYKYQEQYKQNEIEYKKIINELNILIDINNKSPILSEFEKNLNYSLNQKISFIEFEKTRSSKILNLNKNNLEYLKKVKINSSLPQLNLSGNIDIKFHQYRKDPAGDSEADVEYDSSNGDIDFITGIEFIYPLINIKSRAEIKEAALSLKELLLQYNITKNNYVKSLGNIITTLELFKEVLTKKQESLNSLKSRHKTEKSKTRQARFELKSLLETENQITNEKIDIMKLNVGIIVLYLDYLNIIQ